MREQPFFLSDIKVRGAATNALWEIAPHALEQEDLRRETR
jgi:hypothetical protein